MDDSRWGFRGSTGSAAGGAHLSRGSNRSIVLPRRQRRPPSKALVYLISMYCISVGWIGDSICGFAVGHTSPPGRAVYLGCAVLQAQWAIMSSRWLRREIRAIEDGNVLWSPDRAHWTLLSSWGAAMLVLACAIATGL
jgi:hypothetical protein